ncbi:carbohydrate ABC transporter substrate-binding protein [Mediterraneibacter sp. NSJ-55]|uniref:Carbohydrate ABC transporter substrate-binding protein n=1 Tax=Mediterraneibacter hominis TaxID=2763054 RepID=A0A923LG46_9FIRM|nr:ABC transporter substrate-binding protein [Mediterraneibacter hominis]MBC5687986.1 carbohydrate ABC transporter substrate-binding protein [Mediterraneibacter hominis]
MKKRIISAFLISAMTVAAVAGCGSSGDSDKGGDGKYSGVTLNYWSMWNSSEPQGQVIQEAADAFSEETGATINIEWKGRDINTLLSSALSSEEAIDIFEDSYMNIAKNYKDYCYDLTEMAEEAGYADKSFGCFNDKVVEWAGFLCAITEQPQVGGVWYNKDIFEDCGITEVPTTWTEFMDVCEKITAKGYQPLALDGTYADFTFGYHMDRVIGQDVIKDLAMNGGWSENEGVIEAADDIIEFVGNGYLAEGAPDEYPASQNKMGTEQNVAMVVCANYVTSEVKNNTGADLNWGLFNYPEVEGGVDPSNAYAGANSLGIASYSENPQAAFDFVMFLTTGEYDQKMADTAIQIPADPSNTEPETLSGSIETLKATTSPLDWNMGMNDNSDLKANFKDTIIKLYEGKFNTGAEFAAAMDALY